MNEQGTDGIRQVPNSKASTDNTACYCTGSTQAQSLCNNPESPPELHSLMLKTYWYEVSKAMVAFWKALTEIPLLLPQLTAPVMLLQHSSAPAPTHSLW